MAARCSRLPHRVLHVISAAVRHDPGPPPAARADQGVHPLPSPSFANAGRARSWPLLGKNRPCRRSSRTAGRSSGRAVCRRGREGAGGIAGVGRIIARRCVHHQRRQIQTHIRTAARAQSPTDDRRNCGLPALARRAAAHHPSSRHRHLGPDRPRAVCPGAVARQGPREAPHRYRGDDSASVSSSGGSVPPDLDARSETRLPTTPTRADETSSHSQDRTVKECFEWA